MLRKTLQNDNLTKINLELGAGCGEFAHKYISNCYITELNETYKTQCQICYVDIFGIDAENLPLEWSDNRFEKIFLCHPYGYGFKNRANSEILLKELTNSVKNKGIIIILTTGTNPYSSPDRVKKRINEIKIENVTLKLDENINLAPEFSQHTFFHSELKQPITAKIFQLTIYVDKC